jgi:hypothetical protein
VAARGATKCMTDTTHKGIVMQSVMIWSRRTIGKDAIPPELSAITQCE